MHLLGSQQFVVAGNEPMLLEACVFVFTAEPSFAFNDVALLRGLPVFL